MSNESPAVTVVILTFNSSNVIEKTIRAAQAVSSRVVCVDSGSTDGTVSIVQSLGCEIHEHPFQHYSAQRNWIIDRLGESTAWQLHIDADEVLDGPAIDQIRGAVVAPGPHCGFLIRRKTYFLGRALNFGGTVTWHLRLFRTGCGRCEDRLYDQHFLCDGKVAKLHKGWLHDLNMGSLTEWTARHNRWSDLEAAEISKNKRTQSEYQLQADLLGDPRQRTRYFKGHYYQGPLFLRAFLYFCYRYVLRGGFLDGRVGFLYSVLQAFWFRTLVDAKLFEILDKQSLAPESQSSRGELPLREQ